MKKTLLLLIGFGFLIFQTGIGEATAGSRCTDPNNAVSAYFQAINAAPQELKDRIRSFPKGADIHNHLPGSVMPETYINMGIKDRNCYGTDLNDKTMLRIIPNTGTPDSCPPGSSPLSGINAADHQRLVRSLSMYKYPYTDIQSGHDQFFAAFGRLGVGYGSKNINIILGDMLAEMLRHARADNISYVETMTYFQTGAIAGLADKLRQKYPGNSYYTGTAHYGEMLDFLQKSGLPDAVNAARSDIATYIDNAKNALRCGSPEQDKACLVSYALIAAVNRASSIRGNPGTPDLPGIFTQTAFSFLLSLKDKNVAGINLVGAEDSPISMQTFKTVMQFFSFFNSRFKDVNIALHAGELTPCFIEAGNPAFKEHLAGSIRAGAKRLGHAVSIAYLNPADMKEVIDLMKVKNILIESPLTVNAQILGVAGNEHPFSSYWRHNVPVAFATDDEGISYASSTDTWVYSFMQYDFMDYNSMVRLARSSLQHSFAPGAPLWQDVPAAKIAPQCQGASPGIPNPPEPCRSFLADSKKARLQWNYEATLNDYTKQYGKDLKKTNNY
ncbi:MAG: hypothetical protein NTX75_04240 [Proteobacteria bacterium]|nr:hypothetical protein [Pseudomonadota bacterium]